MAKTMNMRRRMRLWLKRYGKGLALAVTAAGIFLGGLGQFLQGVAALLH